MANRTEDRPGTARAEGGVVIVDGPNAVALSLTPSAAERMGLRLIKAAQIAGMQRKAGSAVMRRA